VLFGDWGYYCTPALSEMLKLPRVTVSNVPILDPVHTTWDRSTGRRMHVSNMLAYTPQVCSGKGFAKPCLSIVLECHCLHVQRMCLLAVLLEFSASKAHIST